MSTALAQAANGQSFTEVASEVTTLGAADRVLLGGYSQGHLRASKTDDTYQGYIITFKVIELNII